MWTTREDRPPIEGVDVTAHFDGCNTQVDCPLDSACKCKAGDLTDFSAARNRSFELASGDLLTWIDSDDTLRGQGDLRGLYKEGARVLSPYEYAFDASGRCTSRQYTDRVVARGTRWTEPVHNMLVFAPGMKIEKSDAFVWRHERTPEGVKTSRERSLRILRHWEKTPRYQNDARFVYYLGRVHLDCGILGRASRELERAFHLEADVDKRATIALDLARCFTPKYAHHALPWAHKALELRPEWPSPWLACARAYHFTSRPEVARKFLLMGAQCAEADTALFVDPTEVSWTTSLVFGTRSLPMASVEFAQPSPLS